MEHNYKACITCGALWQVSALEDRPGGVYVCPECRAAELSRRPELAKPGEVVINGHARERNLTGAWMETEV